MCEWKEIGGLANKVSFIASLIPQLHPMRWCFARGSRATVIINSCVPLVLIHHWMAQLVEKDDCFIRRTFVFTSHNGCPTWCIQESAVLQEEAERAAEERARDEEAQQVGVTYSFYDRGAGSADDAEDAWDDGDGSFLSPLFSFFAVSLSPSRPLAFLLLLLLYFCLFFLSHFSFCFLL